MDEKSYRRSVLAFLIPLGALVGVGALLLLFWGATSLWSSFHTDDQIYRESWGLALPQEVTQEYSALSPDRAMGDGWRYTVFQAREAAPYFEDLCQGRGLPGPGAEPGAHGVEGGLGGQGPHRQGADDPDGQVVQEHPAGDGAGFGPGRAGGRPEGGKQAAARPKGQRPHEGGAGQRFLHRRLLWGRAVTG